MCVHSVQGFVIVSALLGAFAFLEPTWCGWFVFIFLVPLFYITERKQSTLTFYDGFLWGVIFFSLHMYGLLLVILEKSEGQGGWMAFLALILYCSLYAGIWFWLTSSVVSLVHHYIYRCLWWVIGTFLFFFVVHRGIFWIFGRIEGYPLVLPLLPLACYPELLRLLPVIGTYILLFLLIFINYFLATIFAKRCLLFLPCALIFFLPFVGGCFLPAKKIFIPDYIKHIVAIMPPKNIGRNPLDAAQKITYQLMKCIEINSDAYILVMPESTFPFPLNEYPHILDMWNQNALFDEKTLIIGAHRRDGTNLYNTFYYIDQSRIIHLYDKKHTIPFIERLPYLWKNIPLLKNLFLTNKEQFSISDNLRAKISITKNFSVISYICSELFYATQKEVDLPVVCIVNDSWFSALCMRNLLYLVACYKAQEWQQIILYISHHYAKVIKSDGFSYNLQRINYQYIN